MDAVVAGHYLTCDDALIRPVGAELHLLINGAVRPEIPDELSHMVIAVFDPVQSALARALSVLQVPAADLRECVLAIAWKELINNKVCTFAEVKIADGSQLRRMIANNSYGSDVQLYPTDMAASANAVIAISGDYYIFRQLGITVYQRQLYRFAPKSVDSCFFTASGDMLFSRAGEMSSQEEAQQFITDNDVTFAVAFGPVMVDNGQLAEFGSYPIGENNRTYSRTAIGQRDKLHYILMTINYEDDHSVAATVSEAAEYIFSKGVVKAYALDGGQTSTMVMNGHTVNRPDWGNQRTQSDIIYFATALPEEVNP